MKRIRLTHVPSAAMKRQKPRGCQCQQGLINSEDKLTERTTIPMPTMLSKVRFLHLILVLAFNLLSNLQVELELAMTMVIKMKMTLITSIRKMRRLPRRRTRMKRIR